MIFKKKIKFNGEIYKVWECIEPLLLMEEFYGELKNIPETMLAQIQYQYFYLKGCNPSFNYTFDEYRKLLPYNILTTTQMTHFILSIQPEEEKKK